MTTEDGDVGGVLQRGAPGHVGVRGLADHLDVGRLLEREDQLPAEQRGLVADQHANHTVVPFAFGDREGDGRSLGTPSSLTLRHPGDRTRADRSCARPESSAVGVSPRASRRRACSSGPGATPVPRAYERRPRSERRRADTSPREDHLARSSSKPSTARLTAPVMRRASSERWTCCSVGCIRPSVV